MDNLLKRFSIIHRRSGINLDKKLKNHGITSGQFYHIMYICDFPGISQETIAHEFLVDKASVARTVKLLEREGYITHTISPEDRRQHQLWPSEKALALYNTILSAILEWEQELTKNLTDIEIVVLKSLLDKMVKHIT